MTHRLSKEAKQEHAGEKHGAPQGRASAHHGHTGEGAASVLAHLISQDQKQRRQNGEAGESSDGEHP